MTAKHFPSHNAAASTLNRIGKEDQQHTPRSITKPALDK